MDTSFLHDLYEEHQTTTWRPGSRRRPPPNIEFYNRLKKAGGDSWTSPFALQEGIWAIMRPVIRNHTPTEFQGRALSEFRQRSPQEFSSAFSLAASEGERFLDFFLALGISARFPPWRWERAEEAAAVCSAIQELVATYRLEPADALHIILAGVGDCDAIVSNDLSFQQVHNIVVYASRLAPSPGSP